jgi:hypothetical protein
MSRALEIWNRISSRIIRAERKPRAPIPVSPGAPAMPPAEPQQDYVGLRINQLFLHDARQWFTKIEPAVYVSTEFLYAGDMRTDPFVVGPKKGDKLPAGTQMQNIGAFGPHPYRGGKLTYSVVLAQLPVKNIARDILDIVEATGKALGPTASLSTWTELSGVVLDGFDRLMGLSDVEPLLGVRVQHDADADGNLPAGHYALIDADDPDPKRFWVRDNILVHGDARDTAVPYRENDFVLYEVFRARDGRRTDVDRLAFHPLWGQALESAGKPGPDAWEEAKANMAALASALYRSPDLTFAQAQYLRSDYLEKLIAVHAETKRLETLSAQQPPDTTVAVGDILGLA